MRRTLLIAACSLFLAGTQAFAADQQKWSKSVENTVSKWEELNLQAPTAVDNAGNTYATGAFTQPIVIGSAVLDPIANSAYLANTMPKERSLGCRFARRSHHHGHHHR